MKKVIAVFLSTFLMFTIAGCSKGYGSVKISGYNYFPGSDWGITKEELYKSLDKSAGDFTVTEGNDDAVKSSSLVTTMDFLSKKCKVKFSFSASMAFDTQTLRTVTVSYDMSGETNAQLIQKLDSLVAEQKAECDISKNDAVDSTEIYMAESKAKLDNLPQNAKDAFNAYCKYLKDKKLIAIDAPNDDYVSSFASVLSKITAVKEADGSCTITFKGEGAAMAYSYARAADYLKL